ncbi:MAG TPA: hypothetical protein VG937_36180 [Polyangiaceae bacterium]|nr:hypothetical protein [Polyangiaceae bacterium]
MLPVAVEVAPANAPREQVAALLTACSRAVGDADCVLAADAPDSGTQAVAIVTWQSDGRATVEVGLRQEGKPEWRSRNVSFLPSDEPLERWRAVGFVVGTLARGEEPEKPAAASAADEVKPEPKAVEDAARPQPRAEPANPFVSEVRKTPAGHPARAALELGAVMGPGLDGLRAGGVLRSRFPIFEPLRSLFTLKYVERPRDDGGLRGQWLTFAAGVAGVLGNEISELSASLDLRAEYFRASVEDQQGRTGAASRWLPGFSFGVAGAWTPAPPLGFYLGAEGAWMLSRTEIQLKSAPYTEDRPFRVSVDGGVRLQLW